MHEAALSLTHSWTGQRAREAVRARGLVNRSAPCRRIAEHPSMTTGKEESLWMHTPTLPSAVRSAARSS